MNKLNFPSDRGFTAFEVEALSRRKKKRKNYRPAVIGLLLAIGLALAIAFLPEAEAHVEVVVPDSFCRQAAIDLEYYSREASPDLLAYCPNL